MIADANAIGDLNRSTEHAKPVLDWLDRGNGMLIVGGKLREELGQSAKLMDYLAGFSRIGLKKLHVIDDTAVRSRTEELEKANVCRSDDPHVVALILLSGCDLVLSSDKKLQKDAQDRDIVGHGVSIYQRREHHRLLKDCKCVKRK